MRISEKNLKWVMRFYPPLFFQRIWVKRFHPGYLGVDVLIHKSILNRNYNNSIFGGTIFSAGDPFYAILFERVLKRKGYNTLIWLKSGSVKYLKPARSRLTFSIQLSEEEISLVEQGLKAEGKYVASFKYVMHDRQHEVCAVLENEIYIRDLNFVHENKKL